MLSPGISWRPLKESDLPALADLRAACRNTDGNEPVSDPLSGLAHAAQVSPVYTTLLESPAGNILAAGWVLAEKTRINLGGIVHPDARGRGLGERLLVWGEERARDLQNPENPLPLAVTNETLTQSAELLYLKRGFICVLAEAMMVRALDNSLPEPRWPEGVRRLPWNVNNADLFFKAYRSSFLDRPGFPDPDQDEWIASYQESPDFRPQFSNVILIEEIPSAFIVCELFGGYGWVSQMGVIPQSRLRGLGRALLCQALHSFQLAGMSESGLHVNINNQAAIGLYSSLGFQVRLRRARFLKPFSPV